MSSGNSEPGMDSSNDKGDSLMNGVISSVASIAHAECNLGIVLSKIAEREFGCSIQSLGKKVLLPNVSLLLTKIIQLLMQK